MVGRTCAIVVLAVAGTLPAAAVAEQASEPLSPAAGQLDAGAHHTCVLSAAGALRCWGYGGEGQLGYANTNTVGDDETPATVAPVHLGPGRAATAIGAGDYHTCALLNDATVRCWGFGGDGRLGHASTSNIGDRAAPASVDPVDLGGHTATAISAGGAHTCALLDDRSVRCWGFGDDGRLGYGNRNSIGDDESPGSVQPVGLDGHAATAITAGGGHTCALLDDGGVRCWGLGANGRLGSGSERNVGYDQTPLARVDLGAGHTAKAISAGGAHTCALLDDGSVRCWGLGANGQLGYGSTGDVGNTPTNTPDKIGPVNLEPGRRALAISAGDRHTCALLDDHSVRCWGLGGPGQLGYANGNSVGDTPATTPDKTGPVDIGSGRSAVAISAGGRHTCALLDDRSVRCWGYAANGRLGYCAQSNIGDNETPGSAGPVNLEPADGGEECPTGPSSALTPPSALAPPSFPQTSAAGPTDGVDADAARARALRRCLAAARRRTRHHQALARRGSPRRRARARRRSATPARGRRRCLRRHGRTPGAISALRARALGQTEIELSFNAAGTDGNRPPAARIYVIKQSPRPIRTSHDFERAHTLCKGMCRFTVVMADARLSLTIRNLRPHTTYYYAVAARDNVSGRRGPRSYVVRVRTL